MKNQSRQNICSRAFLQQATHIYRQHDLQFANRLRAPAVAEYYAEPVNQREVKSLTLEAQRLGMPVHILGNGSNVLLAPMIAGLVINLRRMERLEVLADGRIYADAGLHNARVIQFAAAQGLSGLEFAIGIPGSIGGLVFMNANFNADGLGVTLTSRGFKEINLDAHRVIESVDVIRPDGESSRLNADELAFGYRSSVFHHQKSGWVIVGAVFRLTLMEPGRCRELIQLMAEVRSRKEERGVHSLGCVFRPRDRSYLQDGVPRSAKWFLDRIEGLRQWRDGGVGVDQRYSNHLVNRLVKGDYATVQHYFRLAHRMEAAVERAFGVKLLMEVQSIPHDLTRAAEGNVPLRRVLSGVRQAIDQLDQELVECSCRSREAHEPSALEAESFVRRVFHAVGGLLRDTAMGAKLNELDAEDLRVILSQHDYSHLPCDWFLPPSLFHAELTARGLVQNQEWFQLMVRRLALVEEVALIKISFASPLIIANRGLTPQDRFVANEALMRQLDREQELFPLVMAMAPERQRTFIGSLYREMVLPYSFGLQHLYFNSIDCAQPTKRP